MAGAYMIAAMVGGVPDFTDSATGEQLPCAGYSLAGHVGPDWGGYLVSETAAQLIAINALPQVWAICAVAELDSVVSSTRRTRINTWLNARGWPLIPAGWTYGQIVDGIFVRINARYRRTAVSVVGA